MMMVNHAQCDMIYVSNIKVYPGETFTLPAVVVGADFGTTVGTVYVTFENSKTNQPICTRDKQYKDMLKTKLHNL